MSHIRKKLSIIHLVVAIMVALINITANPAYAAETQSAVPDDSIFQIRIGYEFDDGSFDEWAHGTGFLVSEKYIVTSQTLADTSTKSALYSKILNERSTMYSRVGIALGDRELTEAHLKIYVIDRFGNKLTVGKTLYKSGVGVITLKKAVDASYCVMESASMSELKEGQEVGLKFAGHNDYICEIQRQKGYISASIHGNELTSGFYLQAETAIGNAIGSPIYNDNGYVVGMVNTISTNNNILAINADTIETLLTSNGIKYKTSAQVEQEKNEESDDSTEAIDTSVNLDALNNAIEEAEKIDTNNYTKKTVKKLSEAISRAKALLEEENKTQDQVNAEVENIKNTIDALKPSSGILSIIERYFTIIVLVIAAFALIVFAKRKKKNRSKSIENEQYDDYEDVEEIDQNRQKMNANYNKKQAVKNTKSKSTFGDGFDDEYEEDVDLDTTTRVKSKNAAIPAGQNVPGLTYGDAEYEGVQDLSQIDDEGDEETTILKKIHPYLIRVETGYIIEITKDNFTIGKERKKVDYCITGNNSVSRTHVRIFEDNNGYCIEDQKSTNFTYVNGQQIPAYTPVRLKDGTVFVLSDVAFEFHEGNNIGGNN